MLFQEIQTAIAERLEADAWFNQIPVITEKMGDLATIVDMAVGKIGICVVVETVVGNIESENMVGNGAAHFDDVHIIAAVWETPTINRAEGGSGKPADDTALVMLLRVGGWNWTDGIALRPANPTITKFPGQPTHGYKLYLRKSGAASYSSRPAIVTNNSKKILTNAGVTIIGN
jgi:hypothetical protein